MINGEYELIEAPPDYPGKRYRGLYCYEHHYVYWQNTGHILQPGEEIHHKNGNKRYNIFENLKLTTKLKHSKLHGKYKSIKVAKIRCPSCNKIFFRSRRMTHLVTSKAEVTCCSRSCSGKWPSIKRNNSLLATFRKNNNIMEVFSTTVYYSNNYTGV